MYQSAFYDLMMIPYDTLMDVPYGGNPFPQFTTNGKRMLRLAYLLCAGRR
jgi:hypothetical protein